MKGLLAVLVAVLVLIVAMGSFVLASIYKDDVFAIPVVSVLAFMVYEFLLVSIAYSLTAKGVKMLDDK